ILDNPQTYLPYVVTGAGALVFLITLLVSKSLWRYLRSYWSGVTSGLAVSSWTVTFLAFTLDKRSIQHRLAAAVAAVCASFVLSFLLYLRAKIGAQNSPTERELTVSREVRSLVGTRISDSDNPIRSWEEDSIGRVSLIESICVKLLISKNPV